MDKQIELLLSIVPTAETVGIIFNSSEMNSVVQSEQAKALLEAAGVNVEIMTVTSTNDVQQVMESLVQKVDAIYIPTDNTLSSTMATVGQIAMEKPKSLSFLAPLIWWKLADWQLTESTSRN